MSVLGGYISYLGKKNEELIEQSVIEFLPQGREVFFLDLGCADGIKTAARAARIGTDKSIGIEGSPELIRKAKEKGIKVYDVNLNTGWPVGTSTVDCITATEVVEHLSDLDNFFSESLRVLKKGGKIIISTENLAGYHNILALILGNQPYTGPYLSSSFPIGHRPCAKYYKDKVRSFPHLNVMTLKALRELLIRNGFKVKRTEGIGFYPLPPLLARIFAKIDKNHASYCVVVAEK